MYLVFSGRFMLDGETELTSEQPQIDHTIHPVYQKYTSVHFLVVATWLLSIAIGVAFWALLLHSVPTIARFIEKN